VWEIIKFKYILLLKIQLIHIKNFVFEGKISWATSSHQAFLQVGRGLQKTYCPTYNLYAGERPGNRALDTG
jgi:hypothetical protein